MECNPEDVSPERLAVYRAGGVTRISLGVQSTAPAVLRGLGRHGSEGARAAAAAVADGGFESWNVDLMIGGPGEGEGDWDRSLAETVGLPRPPPHISAYALTVEPGTRLAADPGRHPDEDVQAERYERTEAVLVAAGYRWEEISNWARPGTCAGTTSSTGTRATIAASARRPTRTAPGAGGGTSALPSGMSPPWRRDGWPRPARRS